ncbi:Histidine biosynthesis bifunctional protein hisB [Blastocladiella emersonii ATCC 22665]|nr:Histidine biosynthesis bifunctional protein hisB [Blastocladiella emersonii ATCC 22665]
MTAPSQPSTSSSVYLLDYGAGNVRSLVNAVKHATGVDLVPIASPADFARADVLIFPGVGAFGQAMAGLRAKGYVEPLLAYIRSGKPFMGICVGMQSLFAASEESPGVAGLGLIPFAIRKFSAATKTVPHMGWNGTAVARGRDAAAGGLIDETAKYYFVHSYAAIWDEAAADTLNAVADSVARYGDEPFVSSVQFRNVFATQFHPEKSGAAGLALLAKYLQSAAPVAPLPADATAFWTAAPGGVAAFVVPAIRDSLTKRVIACLDIRANDQGQLVVTKGEGYDVRDKAAGGDVRNLGDPVELAQTYYAEGADEIDFLNITSFRSVPVKDLPMLDLLKRASASIFVPLTIGGGIRDITEPDGTVVRALDVVTEYFRAGADKVSIGSDAVYAAEAVWARAAADGTLPPLDGSTAIEQIAQVYGSQAVVVSVDPRRVYVADPAATHHTTIETAFPGPNGERYCWYQCTVKGGREGRDLDVHQLVRAVAHLGAGEILLNCMDKDGSKSGFDLELTAAVKAAVSIPVVASSGAGHVQHFEDVFRATDADAALAAGIFHRREVPLADVKAHLVKAGIPTRSTVAA